MSGASLPPVLWSTRNNVNDLIQAKLLFPLANMYLWLKAMEYLEINHMLFRGTALKHSIWQCLGYGP